MLAPHGGAAVFHVTFTPPSPSCRGGTDDGDFCASSSEAEAEAEAEVWARYHRRVMVVIHNALTGPLALDLTGYACIDQYDDCQRL